MGWDSKKKPAARKRRAKASRFAESLAKEKFERTQLWRKPLLKKAEVSSGELSALEKFKIGVKQLENGEVVIPSPKSSHTSNKKSFGKKKENVTRSFVFGESDDSADEAYSSWNSLVKKFDDLKENKQLPTTPTKHSDDNWRKTKSAQELNTSNKAVVSEPLKDLFDDSISDSLLYQCTQQVEKKLATKTSPVKSVLQIDNPFDNDSFDDMLSSFPLEEIVKKSKEIDKESKQQSSSFIRHNSLPCQSKITSIVKKVNALVEKSGNN